MPRSQTPSWFASRLLGLTLCCGLVAGGGAQAKEPTCKWKKEATDLETGQKIRSSARRIAPGWYLAAHQKGEQTHLVLRRSLAGIREATVEAGHPLVLEMENGAIVKLMTSEASKPVHNASASGVRTLYEFKFTPTLSTLREIEEESTVRFQIEILGDPQQGGPDKTERKAIRSLASCLLEAGGR